MSESVKSKVSVKNNNIKESEEILRLKKEVDNANKTLLEIQEKYINLLENRKDENKKDNNKIPSYVDINDIEITTTLGQICDIIWIIVIVALMIYSVCKKGSIFL
jgi:hypothetical protein